MVSLDVSGLCSRGISCLRSQSNFLNLNDNGKIIFVHQMGVYTLEERKEIGRGVKEL